MTNFDTHFIKFLMLMLILGIMSGLSSCQKSNENQVLTIQNNQQILNSEQIIGGAPVNIENNFSNKVIYLALGVDKIQTSNGFKMKTQSTCTASALTTRILLTAAHCVSGYKENQIYAVLSLNPWNHLIVQNEWIEVEKIQKHENFDSKSLNFENDIALIKLKKEISIQRVSKIASAKQIDPQSQQLISIGYGDISPLNETDPENDIHVQETAQQRKTLLHYVNKYVVPFNVTDALFKIDQSDLKGFCFGDSGGPGLIYDNETKDYYILGIASYLSSVISNQQKIKRDASTYNVCANEGIYINLLNLKIRDWINRNLKI